MKSCLKCAGLGIGIQVLLCITLGLLANLFPSTFPVFDALLYIYHPMIVMIMDYGHYKGESAIIQPVMLGIPLGIVSYGVVFGIILAYFKRKKHGFVSE